MPRVRTGGIQGVYGAVIDHTSQVARDFPVGLKMWDAAESRWVVVAGYVTAPRRGVVALWVSTRALSMWRKEHLERLPMSRFQESRATFAWSMTEGVPV